MNHREQRVVYETMKRRGVLGIALLAAWGCGQLAAGQGIQPKLVQKKLDYFSFAKTVSPSIDKEEETKWVTFLIKHLFDRKPAQPEYMGGNSGAYEIALLLEIAQHSEQVLFKSVEGFTADYTGNFYPLHDTLFLIERMKIGVPHYETPGWGPRMRPMSIRNDKVIFESVWPSSRSGPPLLPFSVLKTEEPDLTWYEIEKREFGERNLNQFMSQKMSPRVRAKLWFTFQTG